MGTNPMSRVLIREKFGRRHAEGRKPREEGCRDWSDESISQGTAGTAGNPQKPGGRLRRVSLRASRRN